MVCTSCGLPSQYREDEEKKPVGNGEQQCEFIAHGKQCTRMATHVVPPKKLAADSGASQRLADSNGAPKLACMRCAADSIGALTLNTIMYPDSVNSMLTSFGILKK
jgi:hypothetical protein